MTTFDFENIVEITSTGIVCKKDTQKRLIEFDECAKNFMMEFPISSGRCVATRDIIQGRFIFYTNPKTIIKLSERQHRFSLFHKSRSWKPEAVRQFVDLQRKIVLCGFTTYDLT